MLLFKINTILKKKSYKQNFVRPSGSSGSKMILILLIKVVVFYIGSIIINVRRLKLEKFFSSSFFLYLGLGLENYLINLLKIFFYILDSIIDKSFETLSGKFIRQLRLFWF